MSTLDRPASTRRIADVLPTVHGWSTDARRRRGPRLVATAALAWALVAVSGSAVHQAERDRDAWGSTTSAWVATRPVAAGATLTAADVTNRALPRAVVPADPDALADSPIGRRATTDLVDGEIVLADRLAASSGVAALLRDGEGAIALARATPHLDVGHRVDLHALVTGERLASSARVVQLTDAVPVVAVAAGQLPAVIRAMTTGDVVAVLVG
ncbi:MAG: SAF domain-containing protein [Actinomycetota bacterium]